MTFLLLHLLGYTATVVTGAEGVRRLVSCRRYHSKRERLARITRLEQELGLGIDWALDRFDDFAPVLSRPQLAGYNSLHTYAFRCYGCDKQVVYADYDKRPKQVRDSRHLLCDSCLPKDVAA